MHGTEVVQNFLVCVVSDFEHFDQFEGGLACVSCMYIIRVLLNISCGM